MALDIKIKKHLPTFDLDIEFTAGAEAIGFLGASGCGKSLTLRCIAGVETPDEGRILVNDQVIFDSADPATQTSAIRPTGRGKTNPASGVRGRVGISGMFSASGRSAMRSCQRREARG